MEVSIIITGLQHLIQIQERNQYRVKLIHKI
ncbi:hypothetical protein SaSA201_0128 [Streptococcus agalactiae]|nr:hypothetical protein SaSA184_0128 [Streptococcus agalactiae]AUP10663.1 hypothetical protein SaSA191_0128 [Streptococcus agalactiae]AUP12261.1 hypothetical protein SaSA195_0128 [Streptococcus agalactiae]AUP13861.1 hypothetical protein SaSA201_0128 [Streptococcus agalactiae]